MPTTFFGLPLHPLVVHATVVIVPLAALAVLLFAVSSRFRAWAGPLPAVLSVLGLVLVPLSTSTGETLERHVARSTPLSDHTRLADGLLPWMIALLIAAAIGYLLQRRARADRHAPPALVIAVAVLAVASVAGTTVQVARIGHSGAKAAWADTNMSAPSR